MAPLIDIAVRISGATSTVVLSKNRLNDIYGLWREHGRRVELGDAVTMLKQLKIEVGKKTGNQWDLMDLADKYERRIINAVLKQNRSDDSVQVIERNYVEEKPIEVKFPEPSKQMRLF
jgi:hypothetical protein